MLNYLCHMRNLFFWTVKMKEGRKYSVTTQLLIKLELIYIWLPQISKVAEKPLSKVTDCST